MLMIPGFGPGTISGGKWSDDIGLYDIERVPDRSPLKCLIQILRSRSNRIFFGNWSRILVSQSHRAPHGDVTSA
jgi:hypothetical protein